MNKSAILSLLILGLGGTVGCSKVGPLAPAPAAAVVAPPPAFVAFSQTVGDPMGIAADASGNLFVADSGANQIREYSANGTFITQWGQSGTTDNSGFFYQVFSLAMDSTNHLFVADAGRNQVMKYSSDGVLQGQWGQGGNGVGQIYYPFGVTVDKNDTIYLADSWNARVQKLAVGQTAFTQVTPAGLFQKPVGIALDGQGNIFVTDYDADLMVKYNEGTGVSTVIGAPGSGPGQFQTPTQVVVDATGNLYVVDYHNNRVQMLTSSGTYVNEWGTSGPSDQLLLHPVGAVISGGYLCVTDSGNHRIVKYKL